MSWLHVQAKDPIVGDLCSEDGGGRGGGLG